MFFETEGLSFSIIDVLEFNQTNVNLFNKGRDFNALSFRYSASTQILVGEDIFSFTDNDIGFFPAELDYRRVSENERLIVVHFDILNSSFDKIESLKATQPEIFKRLFREIYDCWRGKETGYRYNCAAIFNTILCECLKQTVLPKESENQIQRSVKFLETNFTNSKITIKEIAEKSFISEVYFRKLFKRIYSIPPTRYIIKLRLENAVKLMRSGYYTLNEAAALSGYEDYSYFSAEFKRNYGVSPSKYFK